MDDIAALGFAIDSGPLVKGAADLDRITLAAKKAENASVGFNGVTNEASDRLRKLGQATAAIDGPLGGVASRFRSLSTLIRQTSIGMAAMALGVGAAVLAVRRFALGFADTWSDLNSRIGLAIGNMEGSAAVLDRLSSVARRTYSSLELTAESFLRNATVLRELGKTTTQQLDFTEALNNALVVSGAKADRAAQVQEALGRAMAVGQLRGQELNTVIQTGGRVAEILADELGIGVNSLRKYGEQGKITGDLIYNSLTKRMEQLREEADKMPATIGDAMQLLRNSLLQTIGAFDQNNKLSETFAKAVIAIADNLGILVKAAVGLAVVFAGRVVGAFSSSIAEAIKFYGAVASGNAVLIGSASANEMRARATMESARADRLAAMEKVRDLQATVASLSQTLELALAQRSAAASALEQARASAQLTLSSEAVTAALREQHVATRTVIATRLALAAAEKDLAAAKVTSAAATSAANKAAIGEVSGLVAATSAATAAEAAHAAALARTTLLARSAAIAMKGLQSVLAFFGGPLGLAFSAIAIAIGYWATRTTEASTALQTHERIVQRIKEAYERAGQATADWAAQVAKGTKTQAIANLKDLEQALQAIRDTAKAPVDAFGRDKLGTVDSIQKAVTAFKEGTLSAEQFKQTVDQIAQSDKLLDRGIALSLLQVADNAKSAEDKVKAAEAAIRAINGTLKDGDKGLLGLAPPPKRFETETSDAEKVRKNFEQQLLAAKQRVELAQLDLKLGGESADVQDRARAAMEIRHNLESEALRIYSDRNAYDRKHYDALKAESDLLNDINTKIKQAQALRGLQFDREQLGRTSIDQAVYARMDSLGLLNNGQIVGAQNEMIAAEIRLNEELQRSIDVQKEFTSTFLHGMIQGKSAVESLANAFDNLASKVLDNSLNTLFAGLSGTGAVSKGGIFGGNILPGILHAGGEVGSSAYPRRSVSPMAFAGAPRFHDGAALGLKPDEVPAILQKGETVLPRGTKAGGGGDIVVRIANSFDLRGAYPESMADMQRQITKINATQKQNAIEAFREARSRQLI